MPDTFSTMYRQLKLWVPELPIFLAQHFIRDRYRRLCEQKNWAALRAEGEFLIPAATETGTITATRGSEVVVGSGTPWTSALIGQQLLVGRCAPVYSILAVADATHLTIDRVYGGDTVSGVPYRILQAYITPPDDFRSFILVFDPRRRWRLRHWMTQAELGRIDPARMTAGLPWAVVDRRFNTLGHPEYELWPYCSSQSNYPYYYFKRAPDLNADSDEPIRPFRGDEIVRGALADLARWPGTMANPNPMFSRGANGGVWTPQLSQSFEAESASLLIDLERQDEEQMLTWLADASWSEWPYAPIDASFMQSHAF